MSETIYIGYSPTEFYYYDLMTHKAPFYPKKEECEKLLDDNTNIQCDDIGFIDNSFNCLKQEICKNKTLAQSLDLENNNNGEIQKYNDFKYSYKNYLLKSINLSIGILGIIFLIFREKYKFY